MKNMTFRKSLTAAAVAASLGFPALAIAQDAQTDVNAEEEVERIQVTGSRINRTDMENASPVSVISRADIESTGFDNLGQVLNTMNQADALGLTQATNSTNGNDGTQTISLRGLGSSRTLILVDGRRWLALGGGQVDISQIPLAVVERIEVLADGASAVYGSDAIAGVINIITRDNFDGMEFNAGYSIYGEEDGESYNYGLSMGTSGKRSSVFFNINRVEQKKIMAGDREISKYPVAFVPDAYGSAFPPYGLFSTSDGLVTLDPNNEIEGLDPNDRSPDDFVPFSNERRYNFAPDNYLFTPSSRLSAFTKAHYDITDDIRAIGQFTYNQRKSVTQIAAVPLTMGFSGPQWDIPISADSIYNPFGEQINASGFRSNPIGPRTTIQDYDTYFGTVGLEGSFEAADRYFNWDVTYSRGESSRPEIGENFVNLSNLRNALGPSFENADGEIVCGTPGDVVSGCVPLNLFNGVTGFTDEMADYVGYTQNNIANTGARILAANISGDLFELPAGMLSFAAGYEERTNAFSYQPDALVSSGNSSSNFTEPTSGEQTAEEMYLELAVPVLRDLAFAEALDFSLAWRGSDFTNNGLVGSDPVKAEFDNDSYKFGFTWNVTSDFMLRGNASSTFRAPSVSDLYSGGVESFPQATDPCTNATFAGNPYGDLTAEQQQRCMDQGVPAGGAPQATSQINSLGGGNPFLQPEEGDTRTLGFVYSPSFLEDFDMTLDYWNIELEDALSSRSVTSILQGCILDGDQTDCQFIQRNEATGEVSRVRTASFNLATIEVTGYDASFNYRHDLGDFGQLMASLKTTYTDEAKATTGALSEAEDEVGNASGLFGGPTYKWRSNFALDWVYGDLTVNWTMRHTSDVTESCSGLANLYEAGLSEVPLCTNPNATNADGEPAPFNKIGSVVYHDVSADYELPWEASVRVGVRNLFDKQPPYAFNAFANSYLQTYDIPGGVFFMNYEQRF